MKTYFNILLVLFLTACSSNSHEDLKDWMKEQKSNQKGKIKSLPVARTFVPVEFKSISDPFKDKPVLSLNDFEKSKLAPNVNRRKEPLEMFSLEQLKMTGTLMKDKKIYAMIKSPDATINYVTVGNYLGNNYGEITKIDEVNIHMNERIQENDEWKIKPNKMSLE